MGRRGGLALALAALLFAVGAIHNVPDAATPEDKDYGERILAAAGYTGPKRDFGDLTTFESQLRAIGAVQDAVISRAATDEEIPFGHPREPRDAFEQRKGLCYDRSRAIEKMLAALRFEVRHVAVYSTKDRSRIAALVKPGNDSHALSEVKTSKGWMAVDPNVRWIGVTADGAVVDVARLRQIDVRTTRWNSRSGAVPHSIFTQSFVLVRGLYSRHGGFFAPYTPIPDVNWRQLLTNFTT